MDKLKKIKVYVPVKNVDAIFGVPYFNKKIQYPNGSANINQRFEEKEPYTFDKEDLINLLETVYSQGISDGIGNYSERNNNYINSLLS